MPLKRVLRRLARWRPDPAASAALQLRVEELTAALSERDAATAASGEAAHELSAAMKVMIDRAGTSPLTPMRKAVGALNVSLRRQAREAR